MTNMRELWLWGNNLTSTVPDLSGMTSLDKLKLANNNLTGGIPEASMLPPNMTWLIIDRNPFGGTIPDLSSLTRLRLLWLHTQWVGRATIPAGDNATPPVLDDLNLRDNMLTGDDSRPEQPGQPDAATSAQQQPERRGPGHAGRSGQPEATVAAR